MKRLAAEKNQPPIYRGKWATASAEDVQAAKDAGLEFCYRFRVPKVGGLKQLDRYVSRSRNEDCRASRTLWGWRRCPGCRLMRDTRVSGASIACIMYGGLSAKI